MEGKWAKGEFKAVWSLAGDAPDVGMDACAPVTGRTTIASCIETIRGDESR